jgi:RNase P/RNase MRP subunit p30
MDFSTSESSLLVLPTGAETMQEIHGPRDLANLYKIMGMSSGMDVNMIP